VDSRYSPLAIPRLHAGRHREHRGIDAVGTGCVDRHVGADPAHRYVAHRSVSIRAALRDQG
jgi:hypothetical protein